MKTYLDCIPCFMRQSLDAVRMASNDPELHEYILKKVLAWAQELDFQQTPPEMGQRFHALIRKSTDNPDPYKAVKHKFNQEMLKIAPELQQQIRASSDPFQYALRLALAGNIIDFGISGSISRDEVMSAIHLIQESDLDSENIELLREKVAKASRILYLGDNTGEIVLDRLFIEQFPLERTVFAVRGAPIINDATREDARETGISKLVEVIDNGDNSPGTILSRCSESFRKTFHEADLVIAKGQGNYETLSETDREIFFLFRAKCPVIARHSNTPIGNSRVLFHQPAMALHN